MESLLAADSFRVRLSNGRAEVRGLRRHLKRFTQAVGEAARQFGDLAQSAELKAFIMTALGEIADYGEGFPRFEFRSDGELVLQLRPLPELRESIELRSASLQATEEQGAIRTHRIAEHPERKGPNIEKYSALNRALGAEAVLLDATGQTLEGTTTSILWWDGEALCTVRESLRVASITEAILTEAAPRLGAILRPATILPEDLSHHEAWAVNALHGIRPVTNIDGVPLPQPNSARLAVYRQVLDHAWEPIVC